MATIGTSNGTLHVTDVGLVFDLHGSPWVLLALNGNSLGSIQISFQVSLDSINWFPVAAVRADNYLPDTGTLTVPDQTFEAWYIQTMAWNYLQVANVTQGQTDVGFTLIELSDIPPLLIPPLQNTLANVTNLAVAGTTTLNGQETLVDGVNVVLGTTTGSQLGTGATQKLGLYGATPVVQPAATGTSTLTAAGTGTALKQDSTTTGGTGSTAYTVSDIVKNLKAAGLLAS